MPLVSAYRRQSTNMRKSTKIRAVFVINDFIIGGVQRLYLELFTHLDPELYDLHLVTLSDLPSKADMYAGIPERVTVHRHAFKGFSDLPQWLRLRRVLKKINPDVVVTSLFFSNTIVRTVGMFQGYPIISVEQNTNTWKTKPQVFVDWLLSWRSRVIVAASQTVEDFAATQAHIPRYKFKVIHNSIDMAAMRKEQDTVDCAAVRSELGFSPTNRIAINVARLTHQKNQPMLIEAFARFARAYPEWKLLLLGEGPQREALESLIQKERAEEIVVLAGARQRVVPYFSIAQFFVSTSFIEGFGIAHAEALACGIPLLSTKTAGPDEMIEEGKNGYFVEPTVDSIYEGLVRMAEKGVSGSSDELRSSVKRFDSPNIAFSYSRLIHDVLGLRHPKAKARVALMTYAIDNRPAKGTAIVARKCVEELLKTQDEFELTFIHYGKAKDPIYEHGVADVVMPTFRWPLLNKRSLRQIYYFLTTRDRYEVIQWFQPRLYLFFWRAPALHKVVEVHGAGDVTKEAPFDVMRYVFNWTVKSFIRHIDAAIVSSRFAAHDIIKYYGFKPDQIRIIYNGVDAAFVPALSDEIARVRKKYNLPEKFFIGVGRLNPNKNVFTCLKAYEQYRAAHPDSGIEYVNIGAQGTERKDIDAWLAKSPVKDHIQLVDYVETEDFPAVYSAALALIFPLLNEGFGLPAIEGMACGLPALVAETAYPEIGRDEAVLVNAVRVDEIAAGMERLASDTALREELSKKGRARASSFSWENMGKELSALYRELLTRQ